MKRARLSALLPASALAVLAALAAGCTGDNLTKLRGHLTAPAVIDFGDVTAGATVEQTITIANDGETALEITDVTPGAGFDDTAYSFAVGPRTFSFGPGTTTLITVSFTPRVVMQTPVESSFTLHTSFVANAGEPPLSATVAVKGRGIEGGLVFSPNPVDFGNVLAGWHKDLTITITNNETLPIALTTALDVMHHPAIEHGTGSGHFEITTPVGEDGLVAGTGMSIAPHASIMVGARYTPDPALIEGSQDRGVWLLNRCGGSDCTVPLPFEGRGTGAALSCMPAAIDFGSVNAGSSAIRTVHCTNIASESIQVPAWSLDASSASELSIRSGPPTPVTLDAGEVFDLDVEFHPTSATPHAVEKTGTLVVTSRAANPPRMLQDVSVQLTGRMGGPTISVSPMELNFGDVALGTMLTRRLLVQNTGYDPLDVTGLAFADAQFSSLELGFSLVAGDSKIVEISFSPTTTTPITTTLTISSNDGERSPLEVSLLGTGVALPPCTYEVAPAEINFGILVLPHSTSHALRIDNVGTSECLVRDVALEGSTEFQLTATAPADLDFRIPPGGSHTIGVRYAPQQPGNAMGTLGFYISDPANSAQAIPIRGLSSTSGLLVSPDEIRFGEIAVGCATANHTITVYNLGAAATTVDVIHVVDTTTTSAFLLSDLPLLPRRLNPGETFTFTVSFRPESAERERNAFVEVDEHGQTQPYLVALYGSTSANPVNAESFTQAETAKVDILFVVDNSCSMSVFQASLASNFTSFIQQAVTGSYDYQMAVITCDAGEDLGVDCRSLGAQRPPGLAQGACGYFADGDPTGTQMDPSWRIITARTQPSPEEAFRAISVQGSGGSGIERGMETAYEALSPPKVNGWNAGFLRPDASLAIVVVSDDEEDTGDLPGAPPDWLEFYENYFLSIKGFGNLTQFSFSAIINPPTPDLGVTCFTEDPGANYAQFAQLTGGIIASICPGVDWSESLSMLGQSVFGFRSQFPLLNLPVTSSIEVRVDGVLVPATRPSGAVVWSYDAGTNSVRFAVASIPEPGSTIEVRYEPLCQ